MIGRLPRVRLADHSQDRGVLMIALAQLDDGELSVAITATTRSYQKQTQRRRSGAGLLVEPSRRYFPRMASLRPPTAF
jgi:hypothetical protein